MSFKSAPLTKLDLIVEVSSLGKQSFPEGSCRHREPDTRQNGASAAPRGDNVAIHSFGSFRTRQRPRTQGDAIRKAGARVEVPAKRVPYFKPSGALAEL